MSTPTFRIIAPDPRQHGAGVADLCAKVFSQLGYYDLLADYQTVYVRNSHYDWETSRIGVVGERIVTHVGVFDYQMRIGTARVRCGGIGAVATDAAFRRRGYMSQTITATLEAMRQAGYDVTLLFGIRDFYHRFGFVRAWSDTDYYVTVAELPNEGPRVRLRAFTPRPRPDLAELYNRHYATATGTAVRPTYRRGYPSFMRPDRGYGWGRAGDLEGYVIVKRDGSRLECWEYAGDAQHALRALAAVARRWGCETVRFHSLPGLDPLALALRRGNCRAETTYVASGGAMVQVLNLTSCLEKLAPELTRRLRRSPLADEEASLVLSDGREEAILSLSRGRVITGQDPKPRHRVHGAQWLAQLLLGTDHPDETLAMAGVRLSSQAHWLVAALFPRQCPTLSALDRF